eukprot:2798891-Amphidinium_carterae.1
MTSTSTRPVKKLSKGKARARLRRLHHTDKLELHLQAQEQQRPMHLAVDGTPTLRSQQDLPTGLGVHFHGT